MEDINLTKSKERITKLGEVLHHKQQLIKCYIYQELSKN